MNDVFCMIPWIHMYMHQTGAVFPCCYADTHYPLGDLRSGTVREIWNSENIRRMRLRMLAGEKSEACKRCYELDAAGAHSLRQEVNRRFAHHLPLVRTTAADGTVERLNMPYLDVRFSNICNFKCRTCGPDHSSNWTADAKRLWLDESAPPMLRIHDDLDHVWEQLAPIVARAEEIYFAGGEPLIMDEHYRVLDLLVAERRTDVVLKYSTNFSILEYKGRSVLDLWNLFGEVYVDASLDAAGRRAELIRHGTIWGQIEDNCSKIRRVCPHVKFGVAATVSVLNVLHLPDFHRELVSRGLVDADRFFVSNILTSPERLRVQILPPEMKRAVERAYADHFEWMANEARLHAESRTYQGFASVLRFMNEQDRVGLIPSFLRFTKALDELRGEDFFAVFPELAHLRDRRAPPARPRSAGGEP